MSYLVVKNDTERKSYSLTDQWENKPYLKVKDGNNVEGILPLTTDPEEAITVTETYTHTYETSAETPEGLTDTTALTVESTTGTSYLTESISHEMMQISGSEVSSYSTYNINNITECTTSFFSNYTSRTIVATRSEQTYDAYTYIRSDIYATGIYGTQRSFTSSYSNSTTKSIDNGSGTSTINQGGQTANQRAILYGEKSSTNANSTFVTTMSNDVYRTYGSQSTSRKGYNYNYNFYETYSYSVLHGTTYDLRTSVESTTGTSYLTCESTYGYSGKTSSSETLTRSGYEMRLVNKVPVTYTTQGRTTTTSLEPGDLIETTALTVADGRRITWKTFYFNDQGVGTGEITLAGYTSITRTTGTVAGMTGGPGGTGTYSTTESCITVKGDTISYSQYGGYTTTYTSGNRLTAKLIGNWIDPYGGGAVIQSNYMFSAFSANYTAESTSAHYGKTYASLYNQQGEKVTGYSGVQTAEETLTSENAYSTYRAKYYRYESGSFYTSASVSDGLIDTTALTKEATSYLTKSVTANPYVIVIRSDIHTSALSQVATTAQMPSYTQQETMTNISSWYWPDVTSTNIYGSNAYSTIYRFTAKNSGTSTVYKSGTMYRTSGGAKGTYTYGETDTTTARCYYTSRFTIYASKVASSTHYTSSSTSLKVGNSIIGSVKNTYKINTTYGGQTSHITSYGTTSACTYCSDSSSVATTGQSTYESTSGYSGVSSTSSGTWI